MHPSDQPSDPRLEQRSTKRPSRAVVGFFSLVALGAAGVALLAALHAGQPPDRGQTVTVRRGDLTVTVTAGGALQALKTRRILNDAQAPWYPGTDFMRPIISIVSEGTAITEQDVKDGMVLARMDTSDLEDREAQTEIWLRSSEAWYAQALTGYAIQEIQNQRDIALAELRVRFARMELDRYLGTDVAAQVVGQKGVSGGLADDARLGGAASQSLAADGAAVQLAAEVLSQAETTLRAANQLHESGYITSTELTADQHSANRSRRELEAAREELRLVKRYTLPQEARRRYGDYLESMRNLTRAQLQAHSRLAQAEANLKSSKASRDMQQEQLARLKDSIEKCTIRAPQPGRVVYASTTDWRADAQPIREGQRLWPHESIIIIPDLSTLAARVQIPEPDIEKIRLGQPAVVVVDAMPGREFAGKVVNVSSVASLPDPQINPDLRFYEVDVSLGGLHEGLGPGMTATARITVAERKDVLCAPIGAVASRDGRWECSVVGPGGPEPRRIDVGQVGERFVEVTQGLSEGEVLSLSPPEKEADPPARSSADGSIPAAPVIRGDFTVSVTERGALYSLKPVEIKSEVPGWSMLSEVVDEGSFVTDQDVKDGLVLAKFDTSNLEADASNRQIAIYSSEAAQVQAQEDLEIRKVQNESDTTLAEQNAEFARMELEHYVGEDLAAEALKEDVDPGSFGEDARLGGSARQALRNYQSQTELATENLLRAQDRLGCTQKLYQNGYASRNELTADEISVSKLQAQVTTARENEDLFRRYALPKEVWKRCTDCQKLAREVERAKARAEGLLAQAEAKAKASEATRKLQQDRLDEVRDNIRKCTMRAVKPGQVIYGSRNDPMWYRLGDSSIRPGANVEQNRTVIRIPDTSALGAIVSVPEADIRDIQVGQRALVRLVAAPGKVLHGRVVMASPVARSSDNWLDPDAKTYETDVALEDMPDHFIPGMSATVEIIVADLPDALYVPRQALNRYQGTSYCWVAGPEGAQPRRVEVGHMSARYAEITRGLSEGEEVLLAEPQQPSQAELDALAR
jgi:HlyD family secretion protein